MTDISAAAPHPKIPVFRTAYDAYRLGFGAIFSSGKMFRFFVYGSVLWISLVGFEFYNGLSRGQAAARGTLNDGRTLMEEVLLALLFAAAIAAAQAPMCIWLQRKVLLGDTPRKSYLGHLLDPAGIRYAFALFLIQILFLGASLSQSLVIFLLGHNPNNSVELTAAMRADKVFLWGIMLEVLLAYVVAAWLATRLTFLFPEAACERWTGSIRQAFGETKGTATRLFFLFVAILLPIPFLYAVSVLAAAIVFISQYIAGGGSLSAASGSAFMLTFFSSTEMLIALGALALGVALSLVATAAGAARAYQIRVERGLSGAAEVFS
jgi:hypothetical protein